MDGDDLKHSWKYAFATDQSPELMAKWDKLSCADRIDQIRDQLSAEELSVLEAQLLQMGGSSLEKTGLLDALRWWSLGSHTPTGLNDIALHTRLRSGQSELHRRIFDHTVTTGNLSYRFKTAIQRVEDSGDVVTVTGRDGQSWKARSVICTIPLNVLSTIEFDPPLAADKAEALLHKSVNRCNKVHLDINGPDYLSWSSLGTPGKGMVSAFGDHLTNADNSHLVCFGPDPNTPLGITLDDIDTVKDAILHLFPKDKQDEIVVNRIVSENTKSPLCILLFSTTLNSFCFSKVSLTHSAQVSHDWNKDEFSNGTWCFMEPNATTKYLAALQKRHGNVFFASADWSDGWRGWIDGAVQSGMEMARDVILEQKGIAGKKVVAIRQMTKGASHLTNGVKGINDV